MGPPRSATALGVGRSTTPLKTSGGSAGVFYVASTKNAGDLQDAFLVMLKKPTIPRGQKMEVVAFCHLRRSLCSFEALSGNSIIEEKWVPPRPSFPLNGLSTRGSLHFKQVATICSVPSEWRRVGVRSKSIGCLDLCTRHRMPLTLSPPSGV